jgi:hypothetical protein
MHFEGRLASGPEEICDLFAEFIQRTYTDGGLDAQPCFNSLQMSRERFAGFGCQGF